MKKENARQLLRVLAVIMVAFLCSQFLVQFALIQGDSMEPSYHNMQLVFLNKTTKTYKLGDVVAFWCEGLDALLIKRVAAVPGDEVQICNGVLLVNSSVSTVYPAEKRFSFAGILAENVVLGEDEYVLLGDNLDKSKDSRYEVVGIVRSSEMLGKVIGS